MSYDLYLEIDTGAPEPVCVYDWNYTSNCGRMWGSYDTLVPRLTELAEAMERHHKTTVRVWR